MRPATAFDRFMMRWFFFLAMLAGTLLFPSTREAHVLCLRWLLHLKGTTWVQMQDRDKGWYYIPSVQFTPGYARELLSRSTNSSDDFALARGASTWPELLQVRGPQIAGTWKKNPLLPWMVFQFARAAAGAAATNTISQASLNTLVPLIHLAQQADPTNGAILQTEAWLEFEEHDDNAAIATLWASASNRIWTAGMGLAVEHFTDLFEQTGLSELDATLQAVRSIPYYDFVPSQNAVHLDEMMIQAVNNRQIGDFSKLFRLWVELRRAEWSDLDVERNPYRACSPSDELIETMAAQMNTKLPPNWNNLTNSPLSYLQANLLREQVFQSFVSRYSDPATAAVFASQTESYKLEKHMRSHLSANTGEVAYRLSVYNGVSALVSAFMLSVLFAVILFEILIWQLGRRTAPMRQRVRDTKFWALSLAVFILSAGLCANFLHGLGVGVRIDPEGPELDDPLSELAFFPIFLIYPSAIFLFSGWQVILLGERITGGSELKLWQKGRMKLNISWGTIGGAGTEPWQSVHACATAYLVSLIVMAFFRSELTEAIRAQYY